MYKHICSLGSPCHVAQFIHDKKLKKESYPFDWTTSNIDIIMHCIQDNFITYLNKYYYVSVEDKQCGHNIYHHQMFCHRNPLKYEEDYNYTIRCVERFKDLLNNTENKLFILLFKDLNNTNINIHDKIKLKVINFNNLFKNYTSNYTILCIINFISSENKHIFTKHENIDFLELHTLSYSNGAKFINDIDNTYLDEIVSNKYTFDIV